MEILPGYGNRIEIWPKNALIFAKWKNMDFWHFFMKNHCKLASFSSILPPNGLFLMDIRWLCSSISIGCLLQPKKWVFRSKIFDPAHFWGSGGLIMLPQGQEDVCEQRGPPDDDFEYWTAFVPRRGAEIWAAKVFWRKTKNSRKCIFNIQAHPDAFVCIKMVIRGTNSSHMKTYITVDHSGGIY